MLSKIVIKIQQYIAPNFGTCECCGRPWKFAKEHSTKYTISSGCFPLCEKCWAKLKTPEKRIPYYRALYKRWEIEGLTDKCWDDIEKAVLKGL